MNRLFLKIYVGIAVVLTLGTLGTLYILNVGLEAARRRSFEERLIDSAEFIKSRIQADNLFNEEEELWRLSRAARMVFDIRPQSDLPGDVVERLNEDGETFVLRDPEDRLHVYSLFIDGQVLVGRFGGFRGDRPPNEVRRGFDRPRTERRTRERPGRPDGGGWMGFDRGPGPPGGPDWSETRTLFLLSVIGIPILLVGPAIYFLIRPLDRRIHALSRVAERFGEGDLESRAEASQSDAFGELSGAFNRMADQIKRLIDGQNDLIRAVSHELRTPLARLFFMLDDAEAAQTVDEKDRALGRIQNALTEMNELVEELLAYVRLDQATGEEGRERVSIRSILDEMPQVVRDLGEDVTVNIGCSVESATVIPRLFKRAILNLVTNAARHASSVMDLSVRMDGTDLVVIVDDDGPGVPPHQRSRILEPFIRADESRNSRIGGVGLGLAIVNRVMTLHNGRIEVLDSPSGGARFVLTFPEAALAAGP